MSPQACLSCYSRATSCDAVVEGELYWCACFAKPNHDNYHPTKRSARRSETIGRVLEPEVEMFRDQEKAAGLGYAGSLAVFRREPGRGCPEPKLYRFRPLRVMLVTYIVKLFVPHCCCNRPACLEVEPGPEA